MKSSLLALLLMAGASQAAITISGAAATALQNPTGDGAASGYTAYLIVDTTGNGFLGMGNIAAGTTLTKANDPLLTTDQMGTTVGSLFGGDLILNTLTASGSGAVSGLLTNVSVADYLGMNFALVWRQGTSQNYGILRGTDWTFPAADSGTFTMSPTDANAAASYFQVAGGNAPTAGSFNFRTGIVGGNSAALFGVPEPSTALLGALGVLGLLRRRR